MLGFTPWAQKNTHIAHAEKVVTEKGVVGENIVAQLLHRAK
jgi:hypothetical protein